MKARRIGTKTEFEVEGIIMNGIGYVMEEVEVLPTATELSTEPDKELLEALKHAKSLITLSSISDDTIINRAISNYEKTDQMTYSDYVHKDLAIEFATRFYQLMTSARVDEYLGARKDVCVNDLFEEFLKTKEDEKI